MSVMNKKWIFKKIENENFWQHVFGKIESKNIKDYWPYSLPNVKHGIKLLLSAIENNVKIGIVGDFDVDGSCGTALMIKFLQYMKANFIYYIPNRFTDGYGFSSKICSSLHEQGVGLIITIDNGTTAYEAIATSKSLNIDLIILDHHSIGEDIGISALINPHCNPNVFNQLCATTVVFLFLCYMNSYIPNKFPIYDYIDLVAIATVCDVMPMENINKALVHMGLKKMNQNLRPSFKMLLPNNTKIDTEVIGFSIGPFLNAPGRLGDSKCTVNVLIDEDLEENIIKMIQYNKERKKIERDILDTIVFNDKKNTICLYGDWHEGVIGIIAGRLKEKYSKNTCVISLLQGKASMRSVNNLHIGKFLSICVKEKVILYGGGHAAAGGFTIDIKNIENFANRFENYVMNECDTYISKLYISHILSLNAINETFIRTMESFGPFSNKPFFLFTNCEIVNSYISSNTCHITISNGIKKVFSSIFNINTNPLNFLRTVGTKVDIVAYPYMHDTIVKLQIVDARINEYKS